MRTHYHIDELASKVTLLENGFSRKFRGLKHILLFCLAQHATETFRPPFLLKLAGCHAEATSNWIISRGGTFQLDSWAISATRFF